MLNSNEKFSENQIFTMIKQLSTALYHLENLNIAHRDLKPENIIFKYSGKKILENQLVICDFGFATKVYKDKSKIELSSCGTFGYMAPEIIKAKLFDGISHSINDFLTTSVDMYALGIIFYKMLAGESPWKNTQDLKWNTILKIDLSTKNFRLRNASTNFTELLKRMLTVSSIERISANELLGLLEEIESNFRPNTNFSLKSPPFRIANRKSIPTLKLKLDERVKNCDD